MPFTPSALAQAIAAKIAANVDAALGGSAMANFLAGGNTSPGAYVDALIASIGPGPVFHGRWASLTSGGNATTNTGTMLRVGNGTTTGFPDATFTPLLTRTYSMILSMSASNNTAGGVIWWDLQVGATNGLLTPPWMGQAGAAGTHSSVYTQAKIALTANTAYTIRPLWGTNSPQIATADSNDGWSIIIL